VSSLSLSSFPYLLSVSVHKLVLILMICQIVAKHIDSIACVVLFDVGYYVPCAVASAYCAEEIGY
jgi:hypothetical protein